MRHKDAVVGAGVFVFCLVVYLYGLRPVVWYSDHAEFAVFPGFLTPGHYPGYSFPNQLYYLPHLLSRAPFAAAAALNAVFGAAGVAALFAAGRVWRVRTAAAAALALAFAFTPAYWDWAAAGPEAYNLEVLTAALVVALGLAAVRRQDSRWLAAAALVFALALGNRTTTVFFLPWLVACHVVGRRRARPEVVAAAFALGVSVFLFYIMRVDHYGDQYAPAYGLSARGFWRNMTRLSGHSFYGHIIAADRPFGPYVWTHLVSQLKILPLALAAVGAVAAFVRERRLWPAWAAALATLALFLAAFVAYRGVPAEPYLLVPGALLFLFAGVGAEAALALAARKRAVGAALAAALFALPAYNLVANHRAGDHRMDRDVDSFAAATLASTGYESAVMGEHCSFMPFAYYHAVLRARPDLDLYSLNIDGWKTSLRSYVRAAHPIFGERGVVKTPPTPRPHLYFVNVYPGMEKIPEIRLRAAPAEFLAKRMARLPAGGAFAAALGDWAPEQVRGPIPDDEWRTYGWPLRSRRLPLKPWGGRAWLVLGKRTDTGFRIWAATEAGADARAFAVPAEFGPPGGKVGFSFGSDAPDHVAKLTLSLDGKRYAMDSAGVIFVPLTPAWRPAGPPERYYTARRGVYWFFEVLPQDIMPLLVATRGQP